MAKKEKKKKGPKRKPKYGLFSCVGYMYRLLWKYERRLAFVGIFTVPVSLCLSALALFTPSAILSVLETSNRFSYIALVIVGLLLAKLLCDLINSILSIRISNAELYVFKRMDYMWTARKRDRDQYLDFEPETKKMDGRAESAIQNNHTAGVHFPMDFSNMLAQVLNFILFGSVITLLHPAIILLLAVGAIFNSLMSRWQTNKNRTDMDIRNDLDKKIGYCTFGMSCDFKY